ncbi:MAG: FAD-dependent oxidoreductase, partial [Acidobacteriota bacterium]|nr:FAD-dependent oxidoreductase [Acidobacteriota bacterium]
DTAVVDGPGAIAIQDEHRLRDGRFFRPFFGGIFLETELSTSSRLFEFIFRMFSEGDTALPAQGMQAIPHQLGHGLDVRLNTPVQVLPDGPTVVATEEPEAARLLSAPAPQSWRSVQCLYFGAEEAPISEPVLILNGDGSGPINNCCIPSSVSPAYAPAGASLVSVSVLKQEAATEAAVRAQLMDWFGPKVARWQHLRTYSILYAQPIQTSYQPGASRIRPGLYRCGDYMESASLDGALASGGRAAQALIADFERNLF